MQNIFLSGPRHCDQRLIVVIVYYFQIQNKKEHIIISGVISNHMVPMYIETVFFVRPTNQTSVAQGLF